MIVVFYDSLMHRKFKRTAFNFLLQFFFTFDQFNASLLNKNIHFLQKKI